MQRGEQGYESPTERRDDDSGCQQSTKREKDSTTETLKQAHTRSSLPEAACRSSTRQLNRKDEADALPALHSP